jgi:hypothetical protein
MTTIGPTRRKIDEMMCLHLHWLTAIRRCTLPRLLRCLPVIALLWTLNAGTAAFAQIDDDDPPADVQEAQNARFEIQEDQFDAWIFQNVRNSTVARTQLIKSLRLHADDVDRGCALSEDQRKKLHLAGRGDINRFFEQVEIERQKFLLVRKDPKKFNEIWQDIQPLQLNFQAGLHGENSLFQKTLRNMLATEQLESFSRHEAERRDFHYRAKVELVVSMLESAIPLRDEQRQKLIVLVVTQTKPPQHFTQQDFNVVLWNLSKLPESKLKPLFDETQWKILTQQFARVQGMGALLKESERVGE